MRRGGFVLFDKNCACVGLFAAVASAQHPCPALATELFIPTAIGVVFADPPYTKTNGTVFIRCKKLLMVARRFLIGSFFVQGFLQFSLCLQIELLVLALWLTGLLPQFIRAADNFDSRRPCHSRFLSDWS